MKPNIKNIYLTCIFSLALSLAGKAQVLTLDSVLQLIEKQNPMLQQYDSKIKSINAYAAGATSWMAPMIGAGTFMTPYPGQTMMEDRDKGSVMFSVEQSIPNPAKQKANKKYLTSKSTTQEYAKSNQLNLLRAEAKTLYYQWLVAEKKIKVLYENKRAADLMLKLAKLRYTYNQGNVGNIYKAESKLVEIENMILMSESDIDEKSFGLITLMNLPKDATLKIDTAANVDLQSQFFSYDTVALRAQRSDIKQIESTIQAMQLSQQLQRAQARPDFKIRFDHMQPLGNMPAQFTAMAMVSLPIAPWSSKMYTSEIKGMHYEIEAMRKEQEALLLETQGMLAVMTTRLTKMQQQLKNYTSRIIPALQKNYQTLMIGYEENREQLPVVIDGWETLNMAQMSYLDMLTDYYSMIAQYEKELEK